MCFIVCRICDIFDEISNRASELPETTAELVELQNYLNECRDVTMCNLKGKIRISAANVLFLMQHALLSRKRYYYLFLFGNSINQSHE
jgi:dynein heavy chain